MSQISSPIKKLGAWVNRSFDTVYQAATDGCACAHVDSARLTAYTDGANPPTTLRENDYTSGTLSGVSIPVRKGDYWEVKNDAFGSPDALYWIPEKP